MSKWMDNGQMDRTMDGYNDCSVDRWMSKCKDGWIDRHRNAAAAIFIVAT